MPIPIRQNMRMAAYLVRQKLARREKYPLIVELEPLFACNLACPGCGKIQYPTEILRQRVTPEAAFAAIEESGAPMVSIAGGEPLLHPQIEEMVEGLIARKRFIYLCTNAILLKRRIDRFKPSPYFSWVVHIDGLRERHDAAVDREGSSTRRSRRSSSPSRRASASRRTRRSSRTTQQRRSARSSTS